MIFVVGRPRDSKDATGRLAGFGLADGLGHGRALARKTGRRPRAIAGCVAGAIQKEEYLDLIRKAGFQNITVQKQKPILIPDEILLEHLSESVLNDFLASGTGIFSVTVYAEKAGGATDTVKKEKRKVNLAELQVAISCCEPGSGCC